MWLCWRTMGGGLLLLSFSLFSLVAIAKGECSMFKLTWSSRIVRSYRLLDPSPVQTQNCSNSQFTHGNSDLSSTVVPISSVGFVYIVSDPPLSCGGYIIEWKLCYERERTASSYEIDLIVLRANTDIYKYGSQFYCCRIRQGNNIYRSTWQW